MLKVAMAMMIGVIWTACLLAGVGAVHAHDEKPLTPDQVKQLHAALVTPEHVKQLLAALGTGTATRQDKDNEQLQGRWQAVKLEVRGKKAANEAVEKFQLQIKGNILIVTAGGLDRESTFALDPKSSPKAIDLTPAQGPDKGKQLPAGIYELDGDKLKLCFAGDPTTKGRPKEFKTDEKGGQTVVVLKRVKE